MVPDSKSIITLDKISFSINSKAILQNISHQFNKGEVLAIIGPSGSGKTTLGKIISGHLAPTSGNLTLTGFTKSSFISQQDNFIFFSSQKSTYYSQRYEYQETTNTPSVYEYLSSHSKSTASLTKVIDLFNLKNITSRKLLQLSNGERKRIQLALEFLNKPDLLVLDQPFIGLDSSSVNMLQNVIYELKQEKIALVLICDSNQITKDIDWILELNNGSIEQYCRREEYIVRKDSEPIIGVEKKIPKQISYQPKDKFNIIVNMKNVDVILSGKEILKNINWVIKTNEKWSLLGHNGAGKTTLLSLITADNPQAYKNDIILFDRKRGSGESIWDIKKHIGYVSPELHLYFLRGKGNLHYSYNSLTCIHVVTSGFNDEIGLSSKVSESQENLVKKWFSLLNLEHLIKSLYNEISLGEQRMILLARALIKSPTLLILDEPCQGLDINQTKYFTTLLGEIKKQVDFTLIYVTHNTEEIPNWIDHKLVLKNGKQE